MKKPDSQIGFLKFVIRPTYLLLGEIIPKVQEEVMPIIDKNIKYWTAEKLRMSMAVVTSRAKLSCALVKARRSISIKAKESIANSADTNRSDDDDSKDDDSEDDDVMVVAANAALAVDNNMVEKVR